MSNDIKSSKFAKSLLNLIDSSKRRRWILVYWVVLLGLFLLCDAANKWESPLAIMPRTFLGMAMGMVVYNIISLRNFAMWIPYIDIEKVKRDAQQDDSPEA